MSLFIGGHKHISAFISHNAENNTEAREYEQLFTKAGFTAYQYAYGVHPGEDIKRKLISQIENCHLFVFIVSDHSERSEWVQRELGLAVNIRQSTGGCRPVIVPIYAANATWRRDKKRPTAFPTRDFETGAPGPPFDLESIRGIDRHFNPDADATEVLLNAMTPKMLTSKEEDFDDEATFNETGVFTLYEDLFPLEERDDPSDIVEWVLRRDIGDVRSIILRGGAKIEYKLDSRYFILTLADRAIGLSFLTYDYNNQVLYGNYIAVHKCWRSADLATTFISEISKKCESLFPDYTSIVFEVEIINRENLDRIVTYLESSTQRLFESEDDLNECRRTMRIMWYQKIGCLFFLNSTGNEPLTCKSPCISPKSDWSTNEEEFWIMFHNRPGQSLDLSNIDELWRKTVNSIYVEILAKSLIDSYPEVADEYWPYAIDVAKQNEAVGVGAKLGRYLYYRDDPLIKRLLKLNLNLAI